MPRLKEKPLLKGSLPLKWHGGKQYLADKIIAMMPEHRHYVEPYFGGGAVLFRKPCEGISEVVNDINGELMNFWFILGHEIAFDCFKRVIEATPFSQEAWESSRDSKAYDTVSRAVAFFIRYRQSRQGLGKDFATLSRNRTRRGMNEQVSSWLSAVEGLPEAHTRLKRVVILNKDAIGVIAQQDGPNTLFYLDPPYLHETRASKESYGEYEMGFDEHRLLLEMLMHVQGKFLLSGYHSRLYDSWADRNALHCEEITIPNHASGAKEKRVMTECVWRNF